MSHLFNEANPFGGTAGQFSGKNKGVLLTNTNASAASVDMYTYKSNGTTAAVRLSLVAGESAIFPIRIWGISCGSGITGAVIA